MGMQSWPPVVSSSGGIQTNKFEQVSSRSHQVSIVRAGVRGLCTVGPMSGEGRARAWGKGVPV